MPIYEFECEGCGKRSDHLMRLSDPDPASCPECEAPRLKRVLSAPQFRLAGAGWYETDFKGEKDRKRNIAGDASEKPAAPPAEKAGDKPVEAKPAAKSESSAPAAAPAAASTKPAA